MTAGLYIAEVFYTILYDFIKNTICTIIFSWSDCKSKLYQQCKIKNVCVFLTLTKLGQKIILSKI